ncbi:hypothetical protein [Candidatus Magnetaquicoccus inordinatus]|uniref:hypothetical protein n=1 Tax=Candidatus Magnetaquicoccus inordinatus TaxID=2496818 RepID=UPI00187D6B28|nr:hypothetical protein [Candidatus Magnetaquicoccus inordinatus]
MQIIFCSVVDAYVAKSVLVYALAASWHCYCREWSQLHLLLVGENQELENFVRPLGVTVHRRPLHLHINKLPYSNKFLAGELDFSESRVILLDWDIIFLQDPWLLRAIPESYFAGCPAPSLRISWPLQQWLADRFEIPLALNLASGDLAGYYLEKGKAEQALCTDFVRQFRYVNGGLIVFPVGRFNSTMRSWCETWEKLYQLQDEAFQVCASAEQVKHVVSSDQISLALLLAHEPFHLLEPSHNFLLSYLASGIGVEEIALLHLVSNHENSIDSKALRADVVLDIFVQAMQDYERRFPGIFQRCSRFKPEEISLKISALVEKYALQQWPSQCRDYLPPRQAAPLQFAASLLQEESIPGATAEAVGASDQQLQQLSSLLQAAHYRIQALEQSRSWRMTAPCRQVGEWYRALRNYLTQQMARRS